ncbi:MAG: hypothetical protein ACQEW0_16420 [Pseudomonadota bacterium]
MPNVWFYPGDDNDEQFEQTFSGPSDVLEMSRVPVVAEQIRVKGKVFDVTSVMHVLDDDHDAAVEIKSLYD